MKSDAAIDLQVYYEAPLPTPHKSMHIHLLIFHLIMKPLRDRITPTATWEHHLNHAT